MNFELKSVLFLAMFLAGFGSIAVAQTTLDDLASHAIDDAKERDVVVAPAAALASTPAATNPAQDDVPKTKSVTEEITGEVNAETATDESMPTSSIAEPVTEEEVHEKTEASTPPAAVAELSALARCSADRAKLAKFVTKLTQDLSKAVKQCETQLADAASASESQLQICREDERQNRRTNVTLNKQLRACNEALPPENDPVAAELLQTQTALQTSEERVATLVNEIEVTKDELATSRSETAALILRLTNLGLGPTAVFSYLEGDAFSSFARSGDLKELVRPANRLAASDCADALLWLDELQGAQRPFRRLIWVWDGNQPFVCSRDADGQSIWAEPKGSDEAHIVLFR